MNTIFLDNLRIKLANRFNRYHNIEEQYYSHYLKQLWKFLQSNKILKGILDELEVKYELPMPEETSEDDDTPYFNTDFFEDEFTTVRVAYEYLKLSVNSDNLLESYIGASYSTNNSTSYGHEGFQSLFVTPLYQYLDENIDEQRFILAILKNYKHKIEWFNKEKLNLTYNNDTSKGEKNLALNLYEYLYDQGINFSIEPSSISGEVDMIGSQNSNDPLIADTKIFDGEGRGKSYIIKGFNQVYQYTLDYNETFGYLIIYKICEKDLKFSFANESQSIPYVKHNNKTIFFITIDLFQHSKSASKRDKLNTLEITEQDLTNNIEI